MQRSLLSSTQDLSLPDVTVRVAARRITAYCFKLRLSASFSSAPSFFLLFPSPCLPFPALSLSFFLPRSPFSSCFWSTQQEPGKFSTNCFCPQRSLAVGPSLLLSLSPLTPLSLSPSLSSPCCDRAHLLDLGCTRSESNYPIGPRSHFTVSSPPLDWIFGSQAHLLNYLCLASTENRYVTPLSLT